MLNLTKGQRTMLVDKLPDAANVAAGAMFFGQFLSGQPFSPLLALFGIGSWLALVGWAVVLASEDQGQ